MKILSKQGFEEMQAYVEAIFEQDTNDAFRDLAIAWRLCCPLARSYIASAIIVQHDDLCKPEHRVGAVGRGDFAHPGLVLVADELEVA